MNAYTAVTIINVAVVLGSVAICFASRSAWGLIGFLFLCGVGNTKLRAAIEGERMTKKE